MKTFRTWQDYAYSLVEQAFASGKLEGNHLAALAALSLINADWDDRHPSYYNTQFAVGSFFLFDTNYALRLYAWRMVLNGLGGYWQWDTHNGGSFSVAKALVHVGVMTEDEASKTRRFDLVETDSNCHYFVMQSTFLARIVKRFKLPTTNQEIGGERMLTLQQFREREQMKSACFLGGVRGVAAENRPRYEEALASM